MRIFIFMGKVRGPKSVEPVSVSFSSPPQESGRAESVIVEDLGCPVARRCQNDERPFWSPQDGR